MNRSLVTLVIVLAGSALAFVAWRAQPRSVEVRNACRAFVAQFAPSGTPAIRTGNGGLELLVSLTPEAGEEPEAIYSAAKWHRTTLVVQPRNERIEVAGLTQDGNLIIPVQSRERATEVLVMLCFDERHRSAIPELKQ